MKSLRHSFAEVRAHSKQYIPGPADYELVSEFEYNRRSTQGVQKSRRPKSAVKV